MGPPKLGSIAVSHNSWSVVEGHDAFIWGIYRLQYHNVRELLLDIGDFERLENERDSIFAAPSETLFNTKHGMLRVDRSPERASFTAWSEKKQKSLHPRRSTRTSVKRIGRRP